MLASLKVSASNKKRKKKKKKCYEFRVRGEPDDEAVGNKEETKTDDWSRLRLG